MSLCLSADPDPRKYGEDKFSAIAMAVGGFIPCFILMSSYAPCLIRR